MAKAARRVLAGGVGTVLAVIGIQLGSTTDALAHTNSVSGVAACQQDGSYSVTWTVTNQWPLAEVATISTSNTAHLSATKVHLASNAAGTVTESGISGTATSATVTADGKWTDGATDSADGSVTLNGTCTPPPPSTTATPVAPTVHQAACTGSGPTPPTITLPTTTGIIYSAPAGPYTAGQSITVTATAKTGYSFAPPAPDGWTYVDSTHETYAITFNTISCSGTATPVAPTVVQAQCAGGAPTAPTLTLADTTGITYSATPTAPYSPGQTVTVTATANGGYSFARPAPAGWTFVNSTDETYRVVFDTVNCHTTVTPAAPTVAQAQCLGGTPTAPTLTLANTPGITYTVAPPAPYSEGQTVIVTATVATGDRFVNPPPTGWTFVNSKHETYQVVFDTVGCTKVRPTPPTFMSDQCVNGAPTGATFTIVATTGVDYYVNGVKTPAGTYPAADGATITIVAQPKTGYTLIGQTTFNHTFTPTPDCSTKVRPAAPTFANDRCVDNNATGASYTIVATTGIGYYVNGVKTPAGTYPATDGSTVTITARATRGYEIIGTRTFTHTFTASPSCTTTVATVAPGFADSRCTNGTPTQPTYTLSDVTGVAYVVNGTATPAGTYPGTNGTTITVIAKPMTGYTLTGATRFTHSFPKTPTCAEAVIAAPASFTNDVCVSDLLTGASYTIPPTTGVIYSVAGTVVGAGTYPATDGTTLTVVATAESGFTLTGITQWTHSFPAKPTNCNGTDNQTGNRPPSTTGTSNGIAPISANRIPATSGTTASTGVPAEQILLTGIGLLLLGAACFVAAASRRRDLPTP